MININCKLLLINNLINYFIIINTILKSEQQIDKICTDNTI